MFDEVTSRRAGRRAARRGAFILGSTALQGAALAAIAMVSAAISAKAAGDPLVPVNFFRAAAPPSPPPAPRQKATPKARLEPKAPKPAPTQMIQPREIPQALTEPGGSEPEEESGGTEDVEGVIGGVAGAGPAGPVEAAPAYATAGFTSPRQAEKSCVQNAIRVPRALAGFASSVTVKFAIGTDGAPCLFQPMTHGADQRITAAIWQAVRECRWLAGADAQGRPAKIWVILPFRFRSG